MIEKTFITSLNSKNTLKELKKKLILELNKCGGIITEMQDKQCYYLLFACKNTCKDKINKIIKQEIIKYYSYYKKIEFFKKKLILENIHPILAESFIRALVRFDQNLDYKDIFKAYKSFNTINLESFFRFKLPKMHKRWEELISLTNENAISLLSKQSFEDLLKFLINNLEPQILHIKAIIKDKNAEIFDLNNNLLSRKKIKPHFAQLWLLMCLIKFAPNTINIIDESNCANFSWLNKFFANKIHYIK